VFFFDGSIISRFGKTGRKRPYKWYKSIQKEQAWIAPAPKIVIFDEQIIKKSASFSLPFTQSQQPYPRIRHQRYPALHTAQDGEDNILLFQYYSSKEHNTYSSPLLHRR